MGGGIINKAKFLYYYRKYTLLGVKLGFSIGYDVFGYGLKIPHNGTIVVGSSNRIGNFAVLHTSTCITDNGKNIGDGLYLSTGAKITSSKELGNNVTIGANSLVNKTFEGDNLLIGGIPAKPLKESDSWYVRDAYEARVKLVEDLKKKLFAYEIPTE